MVEIFLNEKDCKASLWPLSSTRHVSSFLVGILTIKEKWEYLLGAEKVHLNETENTVSIPANIIPTQDNYKFILEASLNGDFKGFQAINYPWQIAQVNGQIIREDFNLLTKSRKSAPIPASVQTIHPENIFIEEGASLSHCIINASNGPVYLAKGSVIMEGALIRGPFALKDSAVVKMGAKIYDGTTVGMASVAGGEIKNSVLFGYSNKAHDGYLGDSVIGEWCNLGAGTTNSNVKNNAGEVFYTMNTAGDKISAGQKAGLIMGDYSRSAVNTCFNTGSIVGVSCNIFQRAFPSKYIPDFSWGEQRYDFDKAIEAIENWKKLKGKSISKEEIATLKSIYCK